MVLFMQKIINIAFMRSALGAMIILFTTSLSSFADIKGNNKFYQEFVSIFEYVDANYVEEPEKQKMIDSAIQGMLHTLDPHSSYLVDEECEELWNRTKGQFGGIGVEVTYDNGLIFVITPIDDLPASKAGIKAGDYITTVGDKNVRDLGFNKAIKELRGEPGTKVKLKVYTKGDPDTREVELTRDLVKIDPVKSELDNNIAYVRIVTFNESTVSELHKHMKKLIDSAKANKTPIAGILLDLRNNPGGLIDQVVGASEYFIESGVIVTTQGRDGLNKATFTASKTSPKAPKVPIVVLINGGSASGSEILAGAIQDHKCGIVLGTQSFGKGSVQDVIKVNDRAAIKLTIAKYYTPNGRSIQSKGITPDIVVEYQEPVKPTENNELQYIAEKDLKNHLKNPEEDKKEAEDKPAFVPSEKYKTDNQYSRGIDLIRGLAIVNSK